MLEENNAKTEASPSPIYSNVICLTQRGYMHQMLDLETAVKSYGSLGTLLVLLMETCPHGWFVSSSACVSGTSLKCKHSAVEKKRENVTDSFWTAEKQLYGFKAGTRVAAFLRLKRSARPKKGTFRREDTGRQVEMCIIKVLLRRP